VVKHLFPLFMWSDLSKKELTVGKPALETAFKGIVLPDF
jgi:hypothetical protein